MRSWRLRKLIANEGLVNGLLIRRLFCAECKRIHHELPDCIVPYKRHCAQTIEDIINVRTDESPCEGGTLRRIWMWWNIMAPYFLNVLKSLAEKYGARFAAPPVFKEIVRSTTNSNNWTFVNLVCTRSACVT
jgi:hypothetical protein